MALSTQDPTKQPDPLAPVRTLSPTDPLTNPIPNAASGISQLADGVGGTVAVPPTSLAPPSVTQTWDQVIAAQPVGGAGYTASGQPSGPTDKLGRPVGADGVYHPFSSPEFTVGQGGQVSTFQQPGSGAWTNADGSALAPGTDQWGQSTFTGTGMQPSSTAGVPNPSVGQPAIAPSAGPSTNPIPSTGATAGGAMPSTFSADQNLINSQFNPTPSARLLNTQGLSDQALNQVLNGPDRFALARGAYDDFAKLASANLGRARTDATNAAAAHGQIGSGMLTNKYGDLQERFEMNDQLARSGFLRDATEGTIGDRLNNFGAARSAEASQFGQEQSQRNELRGERGYQNDLAQQAIARRIQQEQMELAQRGQSFNEGMDLYGLGTRYDPTGAYENAAALSSAEAGSNSADVGALLRYLAMNRGGYAGGY